jgi:hypothetical protein
LGELDCELHSEATSMTQQQSTSIQHSVLPIAPIDTKAIVEHGESPTAIILAIAILLSVTVGSVTGLIQVIMKAKTSR